MDVTDALDATYRHTQDLLANVSPDQLDASTPCTEWAVRDLLGHMIGVVGGLGAAAAGSAPAPFTLGDDPAAQFAEAAAANLAAWRADGVLDKVIDGGAGPMPGAIYAQINLLDTATHAWDLARATGQPSDLPADVADMALGCATALIAPPIRPGRFDDEVTIDAGSTTERLAAYLGRRP